MTRRFDAWTALAIVEALAIVLFAVLLAGAGSPSVASPPGVAPREERSATDSSAEPAASTTVVSPKGVPEAPSADLRTAAPQSLEPIGVLLHGTLHDDSGGVVDRAFCNLYRGDETKPATTLQLTNKVHFAVPGLQPDRYRITVASSGMRTLEREFVIPSGAADFRLDLTVSPSWAILVLVQTPAGEPLHAALQGRPEFARPMAPFQVIAAWQSLPKLLPPTDRSETPFTVARWDRSNRRGGPGGTDVPPSCAGVLDMPEQRSAFVAVTLRNVVLAQEPVEAGQASVTLHVDPSQVLAQLGTVRLQVIDASTRAPIPAAKVGLNDGQSWTQPSPVDGEGRIEISHVRPGLMSLTVTAEGRVAPALTVEVAPGAIVDLGQIELFQPFALRVRVVGEVDDKTYARLIALDRPVHTALQPNESGAAIQSGEIQADIAPGRYLLTVPGSNMAQVEIDTRTLGPEPLVVHLAPSAPLRLDSRAMSEPSRLVLRAATGAAVYDRWITWNGTWQVPLLPGTYAVEQRTLGGEVRRDTVAVSADGSRYTVR